MSVHGRAARERTGQIATRRHFTSRHATTLQVSLLSLTFWLAVSRDQQTETPHAGGHVRTSRLRSGMAKFSRRSVARLHNFIDLAF